MNGKIFYLLLISIEWNISFETDEIFLISVVMGLDWIIPAWSSDMCLLSNNVNDYYYVSQGKTVIPGVDDNEEMNITDVSGKLATSASPLHNSAFLLSFLTRMF